MIYLLSSNPRALFDHMTEDARSNVGRFSDYPSAKQFVLRTYAKDKYLEEVDARFVGIKQLSTEDIQHYLNKSIEAARNLAGALSRHELITMFQRILAEELKTADAQ